MYIDIKSIRLETFKRAAKLLTVGYGCCYFLDLSGVNPDERALFEMMHIEYGLGYWFGDKYKIKNQEFRKAFLLEVALNLEKQGFVKVKKRKLK